MMQRFRIIAWGFCLIFLLPASASAMDLNSVTQTALAEAQSSMSQALQHYMDMRARALELGKAGLGTVDSKEELQRQRMIVENFLHATLEGIQAIRNMEPYVAVKVRSADFPENSVELVRESVRSALESAKLPKKIWRMRLDMHWTDVVQDRYQLMQDYWGEWYVDNSDSRNIDSRDEEFIRKFNALGQQIYQIEKQANQTSSTL